MKIRHEDKLKLFEAMDKVLLPMLPEVLAHRAKKLGKDIEKRFRWDLLHASGVKIGDGIGIQGDINLYSYMHDEHIDTALKVYVSERPQFNI